MTELVEVVQLEDPEVPEHEVAVDPIEWLAENATLTLAAFRERPPRLPGFPLPGEAGLELLLTVERGHARGTDVATLKEALVPRLFKAGSVRETCRVYMLRGLLVRVKHGVYRLGPWGIWWLGFLRALK